MKLSELKKQIEDAITEILGESEAYKVTGASGKDDLESFANAAAANAFKAANPNIKKIEKLEETEDDDDDFSTEKEPTKAELKKIDKELSITPEEKKTKFNLGLKFIKKYKDDKPKIDAYLKKAKEEYKFPKNMMDDLKLAAGRQVD